MKIYVARPTRSRPPALVCTVGLLAVRGADGFTCMCHGHQHPVLKGGDPASLPESRKDFFRDTARKAAGIAASSTFGAAVVQHAPQSTSMVAAADLVSSMDGRYMQGGGYGGAFKELVPVDEAKCFPPEATRWVGKVAERRRESTVALNSAVGQMVYLTLQSSVLQVNSSQVSTDARSAYRDVRAVLRAARRSPSRGLSSGGKVDKLSTLRMQTLSAACEYYHGMVHSMGLAYPDRRSLSAPSPESPLGQAVAAFGGLDAVFERITQAAQQALANGNEGWVCVWSKKAAVAKGGGGGALRVQPPRLEVGFFRDSESPLLAEGGGGVVVLAFPVLLLMPPRGEDEAEGDGTTTTTTTTTSSSSSSSSSSSLSISSTAEGLQALIQAWAGSVNWTTATQLMEGKLVSDLFYQA